MSNENLSRRLGVELISVMKGCCVDAILSWRPQCVGEKTTCVYCGNTMKAIRAQDIYTSEFGEKTLADRDIPEPIFVPSALWFSMKSFDSLDAVKNWCDSHEVSSNVVENFDEYCYRVKLADIESGSDRVIWTDRGVLASFGLDKISTGSMISGGMINPTQGSAPAVASEAPQKVSPFYPINGRTEEADGHAHTFSLEPETMSHGTIGTGQTNVYGEHYHEVNIQVGPDGTIDGRTNPSQSAVGGHAHTHKIVVAPNKPAEGPVGGGMGGTGGMENMLSAFALRLGKITGGKK